MTAEVARAEIEAAAERVVGRIRRTPVLELGHALSADYSLSLKLEHLQVTGSFKARGAFSLLTGIEVPATGVVAASGGNFGIAVAYAASALGHKAAVFVPATSPSEKIDRIAGLGADVHVIEGYYDEARRAAEEFVEVSGAFLAHAYDQHPVVAGQGTLAREVEDQTGVDVVIGAVGGGGLIGGIASWFRDGTTVVAAEPESCRSLHAALDAGHPLEVEVAGVAASSLGARTIGDICWAARHWIDMSVLVTDAEIVEAQKWLWSETRLVVEPAAATTIAALRSGAYTPPRGSHVVAVLSGGNVDPSNVA